MDNLNYNGRSGRQYFIIMSLIFLSHSLPQCGQSGQREPERNMSHATDNQTPHHANRVGPRLDFSEVQNLQQI